MTLLVLPQDAYQIPGANEQPRSFAPTPALQGTAIKPLSGFSNLLYL